MKPYYQDDFVTIYHGDCREIVPTLGKFDLLLTDPPYGTDKGRGYGRTGLNGRGNSGEHIVGDEDLTSMSEGLTACLTSANQAAVFISPRKMPETFDAIRATQWRFLDTLVWDKAIPGLSEGVRYQHENICLLYNGEKPKLNHCLSVIRRTIESRGGVHPHQKPVDLIAAIIEVFPNTETILDPFAGSGTTGRAAKDLGRKCTLIEREEKYCEIAARRMQQEVLAL